MMRRAIAVVCSTAIILLLSGCGEPADHQESTNTNEERQALSPAEEAVFIPQLEHPITYTLADGSLKEQAGSLFVNEESGYYLYLLPGYIGTLIDDIHALRIINTTENAGSEMILEALPLDSDLEQEPTESNDGTIRSFVRQIKGVPFHITIYTSPEADDLEDYMAMLATIDTDNIEQLIEPSEPFVRQLIVSVGVDETDGPDDRAQQPRWDEAILKPINTSEDKRSYLLRIPVGEDRMIIREAKLKKLDSGWTLEEIIE